MSYQKQLYNASVLLLTLLSIGCSNVCAHSKDDDKGQDEASQSADSQSGAQLPVLPKIHGFHPIKRALQRVESLEQLTLKLETSIEKLQQPILTLAPAITRLDKVMTNVAGGVETTNGKLEAMETLVKGVRTDVTAMRQDALELKKPIKSLGKPLTQVADVLKGTNRKLDDIIEAIGFAVLSICIGMPLTAVAILAYHLRKSKSQPSTEVSSEPPAESRSEAAQSLTETAGERAKTSASGESELRRKADNL